MSIAKVEIKYYKSIRNSSLAFKDVNLLIGENGTGKSNLLEAIRYFYDSLLRDADDRECYDSLNRFSNEFSLSVTFDFRHLKRISQRNLARESESDYRRFYDWIARRQPCETLTMRKIKGRPARWNQDRQYRQNILSLFPLYAVDAREVDLTDWGQLWDIIGDLMKVHRARESEIAAEVSAIKDKEAYHLEEKFQRLSDSFRKANIQVRPFTPKQYASAISSLLFRGSVFSFRDSGLGYLSNGTNAFNYTNLLIEILKLISEFKMKDPVVILDEPELSLHHKLVDQLTARILGCGASIRFLIATHSPRLLKNVVKFEQSNCQVIHVSILSGYTRAAPIVLFSQDPGDQRPRVFMKDQHANAYFSRYILSVEGASEIETFSNVYLQELFPFLRDVDVMEGMSNEVVQKIISPRQRHFQTRFLLLMDMDKAITRNKTANSFSLAGKYFSDTNPPPERYDYSAARSRQLLRLKRIRALAQRGRFHYRYPFYSCTDPNFADFIQLIKDYLLQRNLYVAATTIEGMLITRRNLPIFWDYCWQLPELWPNMPALQQVYDAFSPNDRLNLARLLFSGKCDFILNLDEIRKCNPAIDPELYSLIERSRLSKTGGWITGWLEFYFRAAAARYGSVCANENQFSQALEDPALRASLRQDFRLHFQELSQVTGIIREQLRAT